MAASATFALKAGVWFRRGRLLMVSPGSRRTACPLSGRNSTYRPVQISGTGSKHGLTVKAVRYLTLVDNRKNSLRLEDLPFSKRVGYIHENEFRVIYESTSIKKKTFDVAIPLSCINRINVSYTHLKLPTNREG